MTIKRGEKVLVNDNIQEPFEAIVLKVLEDDQIAFYRVGGSMLDVGTVGLKWVRKVVCE